MNLVQTANKGNRLIFKIFHVFSCLFKFYYSHFLVSICVWFQNSNFLTYSKLRIFVQLGLRVTAELLKARLCS